MAQPEPKRVIKGLSFPLSDDPQHERLRQAMLPERLRLSHPYEPKIPQSKADYDALSAAAQRRKTRGLRRLERTAVML